MKTSVDMFVDYVCPFCFLVEPTLEELARKRGVEITIRPFELRPYPAPTLKPEDNYLPQIWKDAVYPMANRVGIPIKLPSISPQPRTEAPFIILQVAQEKGLAAAYSQAIFRAFFQQDLDIGKPEVIARVAKSIGIPHDDVMHALSSSERRSQHRENQAYATNVVGVTAVPAFHINGKLIQGVPNVARLVTAVDTPPKDDLT